MVGQNLQDGAPTKKVGGPTNKDGGPKPQGLSANKKVWGANNKGPTANNGGPWAKICWGRTAKISGVIYKYPPLKISSPTAQTSQANCAFTQLPFVRSNDPLLNDSRGCLVLVWFVLNHSARIGWTLLSFAFCLCLCLLLSHVWPLQEIPINHFRKGPPNITDGAN